MNTHSGKKNWAVAYKVKHDQAIPPLGIYSKEIKTYVQKKTCTEVVRETESVTAKAQIPINKLFYVFI